jgi:hypothetical protein
MSEPQGLVQPEGLGKFKDFIYFIGSRTRDVPACSKVAQTLRCRVPRTYINEGANEFCYMLK